MNLQHHAVHETRHHQFLNFWMANRSTLLKRCLGWARGSASEAEELLSVACLRAFEALRRTEPEVRDPAAWWSTIVANTARDLHRNRLVTARRFGAHAESVERLPDELADAERRAMTRERLRVVRGGITRLTAGQRSALLLRSAGHDYEQIALELQTSRAAARKLVHLARQRLRDDSRA